MKQFEFKFEVIKTLIAMVVALLVTLFILFFVSSTPVESFIKLLVAPVSKVRYFGNVLETMVPIGFAGLATALLFKTGLFNLGTEGIFYISGVFTAFLASRMFNNPLIDPLLVILLSSLFGGLVALIPAYFKVKYNTNELVLSLMLNSILYGIGLYVIKTLIRATDVPSLASEKFLESTKLFVFIPNTRTHIGVIIFLITCVLVAIMMYRSKLGYAIRMTGMNPNFAKYSGMNAFVLFLVVHFISGVLAAMGSSIELLGMYERFTWIALPGLGFTGALIAMLGKNNPIGVLIASFGMAYIKTGAEIMSRTSDVPVEMVAFVEAILVFLITSEYFLKRYKDKMLLKKGGQA